jgi:hypothetical protein
MWVSFWITMVELFTYASLPLTKLRIVNTTAETSKAIVNAGTELISVVTVAASPAIGLGTGIQLVGAQASDNAAPRRHNNATMIRPLVIRPFASTDLFIAFLCPEREFELELFHDVARSRMPCS